MTTNQTERVSDEELDQMIWKLERDGMTPKQLSLMRELREVRRAKGEPVARDYDIHMDANRYRFLRDKDAFGDEGEPGLASWDAIAQLDMGDFYSAVDARLLSCEMPQHILTEAKERTATAGVYAELYRLREEVKGPHGFDTWKDAAIAERKTRVELEKASQRMVNIDYLGAMAAFHSDQWHKIGPITGYMHGWNACRAAMLAADGTLTNEGTMQSSGNSEQLEPVSNSDELPLDYLQGHKDGLEWAAQLAEANHPQTGDWLYDDPIELARAIRKGPDMPTVQDGNSPVTPDGWVMVPMKLTAENGAKAALIGEFNLEYTLTCHECFGEGCDDCSGEGAWINTIPIDWTTIKEIWAKGVEHFSVAPQEAKGE